MSEGLVSTSRAERVKATLVSLSLMLLAGAAAVGGRPGLDIWPLYWVGQWLLASYCLRAPSLRSAALHAAAWGVPLGVGVGIGGTSWGAIVPIGIALTVLAFVAVPQGLLARFAVRRARSLPLFFMLVASAWTAWLSLGDWLGIPCRGEVAPLLAADPFLLLGARVAGASTLCGIVLGGVTTSALAWLRAAGAPLVYRVRCALQPAAVAASLVFGLAALGRATAPAADGELLVGVPQVDADATYYQSRMTFPPLVEAFERRISDQLQALVTADVVVFTETYDGRYGLMLPAERARLAALAKNRSQAWLVTSFLVESDGRKSNAVGALTKEGRWAGLHRKVALAPYGERALAPGDRLTPIDLQDGTVVGVVICNEASQSSIVRALVASGANLLAASTSDISFGSSVLAFEHLVAARVQAVEVGRDMVWASNGGPSGVLSRFGGFEPRAPFRAPLAMLGAARTYSDVTPFVRQGLLWVGLAVALLSAALVLTRNTAGELPAQDSGVGKVPNWLATLAVSVALVLTTAVPVAEPAGVELRYGERRRAWAAIPDLFRPKRTLVSFEAHRARPQAIEVSGAAAVRLLAAYYGAEGRVRKDSAPASFEELGQELAERFDLPTRLMDLARDGIPCVAAIVQMRGGDFGIATRPEGEVIELHRPRQGTTSRITAAALLSSTTGQALLPAPLDAHRE